MLFGKEIKGRKGEREESWTGWSWPEVCDGNGQAFPGLAHPSDRGGEGDAEEVMKTMGEKTYLHIEKDGQIDFILGFQDKPEKKTAGKGECVSDMLVMTSNAV